MTLHKPIKLPSGARLSHGQLIGDFDMIKPRRLNSSMPADKIGRDGRVSKLSETTTIPVKPGMTRRTKGQPHPYLHGSTLQDQAEPPVKSYETPAPIHGGMTKAQVDKVHPVLNNPGVILTDAANLGRKA